MSSTSKDAPDKKRKKTSKSDLSPLKGSGLDGKKIKLETHRDSRTIVVAHGTKSPRQLFYQEDEESMKRDAKQDMELYKAACEEIQLMMLKVKKMKDSDSSDTAVLDECRIHGSLQFATLKKLNRLAHMRCKKVRDSTHEAKQKIDQYNLQLQNLLYETTHLQKEITKCLEFTSKDEDIELVDVEEFYKEAPPEISKIEKTEGDEHELRLARLDWELEQRKQLAKKLKDALSSKEGLSKNIATKKENLDSLQPKLNAILKETKPIQEELGMPFDEVRQQHKMARFLPRPLYVLYMQASAYHEACDKAMSVTINGEMEEVKSLEPDYAAKLLFDSDSEPEEQEDGKKVSKHRRKTAGDKLDLKRKKLLRQHPLTVDISINCGDSNVLELNFCYLMLLEVVTVKLKANINATTSISGGDLLSEDMLLNCLYPGDDGKTSPNPTNGYPLNKLGITRLDNFSGTIGKPYMWAQWLSGLEFLESEDAEFNVNQQASNSVSSSRMEETLLKIRRRVNSRIALQKQLASLERCSVNVSPEHLELFPHKVLSKISSWKRTTYEDFVSVPYTEEMTEEGLVQESDMFFTTVLERGSAKLIAQVVISPDYPNQPPLLATQVHYGTKRTAFSDESIKEIEAEVNLHFEELTSQKSCDQLLSNQMQRLLMCFDVYLETEENNAAVSGPKEFPKENIYQRTCRGRNRGRPYFYNKLRGYFIQRH
ncbi:unnamed protein product [Owenia fusiformis]|uniref:Uncharacterized protein n=1 Tax=Owenia fusiformis TaxID=6347 RepID=A0A8J1TK90_OWEFU|nr:unnamed protein product [Owenia fusiformis]